MADPFGAPYTPPPNAPPGVGNTLGVQPGLSAGIVIANVLFIIGTGDGLFIYNGTPTTGNLIGSWASSAGTDQFGNPFPAGINATQGVLNGITINTSTLVNGLIQGGVISTPQIQQPAISGGTITETQITFDTSGGALLVYSTTTTTTTQTVQGTYQFTVPANVTQGRVQCWGAGSGGGGGNGTGTRGGAGGSGGEYAEEPAYPLTAGKVYTYIVGNGGSGGLNGGGGGDGGVSIFDTTNNGVVANPGLGTGTVNAGTGGTGSTNTIHFNGAAGGSTPVGDTGGSGGGGSGGSTGAGGVGVSSSGSTGAAGGAAGTGGGAAGGAGGNNAANGVAGNAPGAGGGGAGAGSSTNSFDKTYTCTATHCYQGSDGTNPNQKINDNSTSYQGGDKSNTFNGKAKTWIVFPSSIQGDLAGVTLTNEYLTLHNTHSWFFSGMTVAIGYDNASTFGGTKNDPSGSNIDRFEYHQNENATLTKDITNHGFGTAFQNGTGTQIVLFKNSNDLNYYGSFAGKNQSGPATLRFVGTTGSGVTQAGGGADGKVSITVVSGTTLIGYYSAHAFTDAFGNAIPAAIGNITQSTANATNNTVTQAVLTDLLTPITIPANDAKVGTTYVLKGGGNGVWGSTQQQLTVVQVLNGVGAGTNQQIAATAFAVSAIFRWDVEVRFTIITTGVSGTAQAVAVFSISETANPVGLFTAATQSLVAVSGSSTAFTFNTTVSNTIGFQANWASTTGAPTINSKGTAFIRLGL